jgi:hypothetical protein
MERAIANAMPPEPPAPKAKPKVRAIRDEMIVGAEVIGSGGLTRPDAATLIQAGDVVDADAAIVKARPEPWEKVS